MDVNALPRLIDRHNTCFPSPKKPKPMPIAQPAPSAYGRGAGPSGVARSSKALSKAKKSRTKSASPSRKAESDLVDMAGAPSAGAPAAPEAAQAEAREIPSKGARDAEIAAEREAPMRYDDWGAKIYLSNDDTMSLSSAQRVLYAIDNFLPLPAEHIRPHELLNYFSFDTAPVQENRDFSVAAGIADNTLSAGLRHCA